MTGLLPFPESVPPAATGICTRSDAHKFSNPRRSRAPRSTPPAHHNAPTGTSEVAAARIAGGAAALRSRILTYIVARGSEGATDDEGETALGIKCQTYTPRRGELVRDRLVIDSGQRRPTGSGRQAAVWIAVASTVRGEVRP